MDLKERLDRIEALLLIGSKEVFDMAEAASFLGISKERLYHLVSDREIPHYKKGKSNYFKKSELEAWMTETRVPSNSEVKSEAVRRFHK